MKATTSSGTPAHITSRFTQEAARDIAKRSFRQSGKLGTEKPLRGKEPQLLEALLRAEQAHDKDFEDWKRQRKQHLEDRRIFGRLQEFNALLEPVLSFWQEMDEPTKTWLLRQTQNQLQM